MRSNADSAHRVSIFRLPIGKAAFFALFLAGCAAPSLPSVQNGASSWAAFLADGSREELPADWDDIDAAVMIGASRSEMAVVAANRGPTPGAAGDPCERIFKLKTIRDEPAWLRVTRSGDQRSPHIVMHAKVGRSGDEQREKEFLRHVSARLEELHGRATAPLPR
jgi:hypothetical protein